MTREEAIEILWQYDVDFEPHPAEKVMHAIDMAIEALSEPKTGEWLPCTKNGLILTELIRKEDVAKWYGYKCSKCNYIYRGNALIECSYCPNCGAKMGGDTE